MCLPQVVAPPPHLSLVTSRCHPLKQVWREKLKLSTWHVKALQAMPIEWISPLEANLPFDSAARYPVGSKERLACSATLEHYIKIGSIEELPPETSDGPWWTFFPVLKKGTDKMQGCIDLCRTNKHIEYEHFKMEGLHTIQQLIRRNDYITKVDLSDFYMHFLIGKADCRYMRFMWEGKMYQCTPAPRLATKMIAPVIRYLWSCSLQLAIYIDELILLPLVRKLPDL